MRRTNRLATAAAERRRSNHVAAGVMAVAICLTAWTANGHAAPIIIEPVRFSAGTHRDAGFNGAVDLSFQSSVVVNRNLVLEQRGVSEFDIRGVRSLLEGGNVELVSVRLELTAFGPDVAPTSPTITITNGYVLDLYGFIGNGSFAGADYGAGDFLARQTLDNADPFVDFNVSDFVIPSVLSTANFVGINLRSGGTPGVPQPGFAQFRSGPDGVRPRLVFDFRELEAVAVSEPAGVSFLAVGLAAIAAARRSAPTTDRPARRALASASRTAPATKRRAMRRVLLSGFAAGASAGLATMASLAWPADAAAFPFP